MAQTIVRGSASAAQVALTFDDGPDPLTTPRVLDILAKAHVSATFFLLGARVAAQPALARAIVEGGHSVGNHSYSHRNLASCGERQAFEEIRLANLAIEAATGIVPTLFRPPYGAFASSIGPILESLALRMVHWTIAPGDWNPQTTGDDIIATMSASLAPGSIVLLHDSLFGSTSAPTPMLEILPPLIDLARGCRLDVVPLSDLLAVDTPMVVSMPEFHP